MSDSPGTGPAADVDPLTVFDPAKWEPDLRAMTRIVLRPIGTVKNHSGIGVRRTL